MHAVWLDTLSNGSRDHLGNSFRPGVFLVGRRALHGSRVKAAEALCRVALSAIDALTLNSHLRLQYCAYTYAKQESAIHRAKMSSVDLRRDAERSYPAGAEDRAAAAQ